jgi:hypothetical protein
MELWAGVGLNDIDNKGVQLGTLTARLEGNILTVRYNMFEPNKLTTVQLYIGQHTVTQKKTVKSPYQSPTPAKSHSNGPSPAASYEFSYDITSNK